MKDELELWAPSSTGNKPCSVLQEALHWAVLAWHEGQVNQVTSPSCAAWGWRNPELSSCSNLSLFVLVSHALHVVTLLGRHSLFPHKLKSKASAGQQQTESFSCWKTKLDPSIHGTHLLSSSRFFCIERRIFLSFRNIQVPVNI